MFGHSHLFGDIFDLIMDSGGRLSKVVLNMPPEPPSSRRLALADRLGRLPYPVETVDLGHWKPNPEESYVIGFSRKQMKPLLDQLASRFGIDSFGTLVHSRATIQHGAVVSESAMIDANAVVGPWARIGRHVFVNRGASVGHDCDVGDFSFLAPSSTLCGYVRLCEDVMIGAGATILPDIAIGAGAQVAAGTVVTKDVPPGTAVAGVPARVRRNP